MSSKTLPKLHQKLAFRLTLWYAGIFALCCGVTFFLFYVLITSELRGQIDQNLTRQAGVFSSLLDARGIAAVKSVAVLETQASGEKKIFFRLLSPAGEVFSSSNMSYWQDIGIGQNAIRALLSGTPRVLDTIDLAQGKPQVRILYTVVGPGILLQLGQSMENIDRFVQAFRKIVAVTMGLLILLSAGIGWFMAQRAVSGVASVTRTARQITGGDLTQRVPLTHRQDEIDQLATTFNQMLDRIELLVTSIREMSDNIAHDLKSPITRIRGIAEISLTTGTSMEDYRAMGAQIIEDCDRLLEMINTMLMISKTEAGIGGVETESVDLAPVLQDACELFRPLAEDKGIRLDCDTTRPARILGDRGLIQRMTANLLDNAIKYTPTGGRVDLWAETDPAGVRICFRDTGIGIAPEDISHIFERFFRCDQSRTQPGTGLGLSLARAIARAHGGEITVTSRPGQGSTFTVELPQKK